MILAAQATAARVRPRRIGSMGTQAQQTHLQETPPQPRAEGWLETADGHRLWYAELGNPEGIPFVWMHGGPGSGSSLRHAELIDRARYRLILLDQRGCGRSLPQGELRHNTFDHLIDDVELLRQHLKLERFLSGGGSWGATLALCHAARYPESVAGLILRSPFLGEGGEIAALFRPSPGRSEPAWEALSALAPEGAAVLPYAAAQLAQTGADALAIARAWHRHASSRETGQDPVAIDANDDIPPATLLARYRVQSHYLVVSCFLGAGEVLRRAATLTMPAAIFHGQADRVCAPDNALALATRMRASALRRVPLAGHDPFHPEMVRALADAQRSFARHGHFSEWGECPR